MRGMAVTLQLCLLLITSSGPLAGREPAQRIQSNRAIVPAAAQALVNPPNEDRALTSRNPSLNSYNWTAKPASPTAISPGSNTVLLSACPAGFDVTALNTQILGLAGWYVRLPDNGSDEVALITGGTCKPGMSNGTIIITAANSHSAGYTVESASDGLQEAINDGCYRSPAGYKQPVTYGGEFKLQAHTTAEIYAPIIISCNNETVDLTGGLLHSHVNNAPTIYVGMAGTPSYAVNGVTIINPAGQPEITGNTGAFIEVNAMHTRLYNVTLMLPYNNVSATFGTFVKVDDDQAFLLDGLDNSMLQGRGLPECNTKGCPAAISTGSGYAVGWIKHLNLNLGCMANGIRWSTGNGLRLSDSVVQAYPQYGIWVRAAYGTGVNVFDNVYEELGSCLNPLGVGSTGLICQNGMCVGHQGNSSNGSAIPEYACSTKGEVVTYYYLVATYSGGHASEPYLAGYSKTDGRGRCTVKFPQFGLGISGYDLLSKTGSGTTGPPFGKGNFARHTGLDPHSICAGSGDNAVCSVSDDTDATPSAYTVVADRGAIFGFWPAGVLLTSDMHPNSYGSWSKIEVDRYYLGAVVSAGGALATSVYATWCNDLVASAAYSDTVVNCEGQNATLNLSAASIPANRCGPAQMAKFPLPLVFSSSIIHWSFASSPAAIAGWRTGGLRLDVYPVYPTGAGVIVCNTTSAPITPGNIAINLSVENP